MPISKFKRTCKGQRGKTGHVNNAVMFWVLNSEVGRDHVCAYHCYFRKMRLNVAHIISNTSCPLKIVCGMQGSKNPNVKIILTQLCSLAYRGS